MDSVASVVTDVMLGLTIAELRDLGISGSMLNFISFHVRRRNLFFL